MARNKSELANFEATTRKILAVSREELTKREADWKQEQLKKKKKRANVSPASRAANDPV